MPPIPDTPADWRPLDPFPGPMPPLPFVSDDPPGNRLRVAYFQRGDEPILLAKAWFGPGTEGPPGHAHGGSIAAVLDEALGAAAWMAGHRAVVARLTVDFREMVRLDTDATVEAWVTLVEGRKVTCRARLLAGDRLLAEAEAVCVTLTPGQLAALSAGGSSASP
jgi:acyl-coenzyme A thioesterase PaaI-like protein